MALNDASLGRAGAEGDPLADPLARHPSEAALLAPDAAEEKLIFRLAAPYCANHGQGGVISFESALRMDDLGAIGAPRRHVEGAPRVHGKSPLKPLRLSSP